MKRSVFAQLKRKDIFRNTSTKNPPPKNLSGISRKMMLLSTERKSTTDVSFARNTVTLLETVRLIQYLQHSSLLYENEDVESNFSEQSEQDNQTAFIIA